MAPEIEARLDEGLGQVWRGVVGDGERLPGLQRLQRRVGENGGELGNRGVLLQHHPVHACQLRAREKAPKLKSRRGLRQGDQGRGIVGLVAVAPLRAGPAGFGNTRFIAHDRLSLDVGVRPADQVQQLRHIGLIGRPLRRKLRLEIVVAVRQAEACLRDVDGVSRRRLGVGRDVRFEQR